MLFFFRYSIIDELASWPLYQILLKVKQRGLLNLLSVPIMLVVK